MLFYFSKTQTLYRIEFYLARNRLRFHTLASRHLWFSLRLFYSVFVSLLALILTLCSLLDGLRLVNDFFPQSIVFRLLVLIFYVLRKTNPIRKATVRFY